MKTLALSTALLLNGCLLPDPIRENLVGNALELATAAPGEVQAAVNKKANNASLACWRLHAIFALGGLTEREKKVMGVTALYMQMEAQGVARASWCNMDEYWGCLPSEGFVRGTVAGSGQMIKFGVVDPVVLECSDLLRNRGFHELPYPFNLLER